MRNLGNQIRVFAIGFSEYELTAISSTNNQNYKRSFWSFFMWHSIIMFVKSFAEMEEANWSTWEITRSKNSGSHGKGFISCNVPDHVAQHILFKSWKLRTRPSFTPEITRSGNSGSSRNHGKGFTIAKYCSWTLPLFRFNRFISAIETGFLFKKHFFQINDLVQF